MIKMIYDHYKKYKRKNKVLFLSNSIEVSSIDSDMDLYTAKCVKLCVLLQCLDNWIWSRFMGIL